MPTERTYKNAKQSDKPFIAYYKRKGSGKLRNREVYAKSEAEARRMCPETIALGRHVWRLYGGPLAVTDFEGLGAPTI